jgi:hypothetical protein
MLPASRTGGFYPGETAKTGKLSFAGPIQNYDATQ